MQPAEEFRKLVAFLGKIPAIDCDIAQIGSGRFDNGNWWVKFALRLEHPLAWRTVQELGHVLNYLSIDQRLPTVFKPVSPPPHLNGGVEFLSWVIESSASELTPDEAAQWLECRLPRPVDDVSQWAEEP